MAELTHTKLARETLLIAGPLIEDARQALLAGDALTAALVLAGLGAATERLQALAQTLYTAEECAMFSEALITGPAGLLELRDSYAPRLAKVHASLDELAGA